MSLIPLHTSRFIILCEAVNITQKGEERAHTDGGFVGMRIQMMETRGGENGELGE